SSPAAGEIVSIGQGGQGIAVAGGNVRWVVHHWLGVDGNHEAVLGGTVWVGPGLCVHIDGLGTGDDVAGKQWVSGASAPGDVVSVRKCRQYVAVARGDIRWIVNHWRGVDGNQEAVLCCTVWNGPGLCVHIDCLSTGYDISRKQRSASSPAAGEIVSIGQGRHGIAV